MRILFIDVETSGLEPNIHEILSYAFKVYDTKDKSILYNDSNRIRHERLVVDPIALKVNQIDLREFLEGISKEEFAVKLQNLIIDYNIKYIAGWNIIFDFSFIKKYLDNRTFLKTIDIMQMYFFNEELEKHSLEYVAKYYNIKHTPHNVESDLEAMFKLYERS